MSFTKKSLRNLAASFAVVAAGSSAFAQEDTIANDNAAPADNDYAFSCDQESYAGQNLSAPDIGDRILPGNVYVQVGKKLSMPYGLEPKGKDAPTMRAPRGSSGSGFIIDAQQGYIVTNAHVIQNKQGNTEDQAYTVTLYDPDAINNLGEQFDAELIGIDGTGRDKVDLAVLQINAKDTPLTCVHLGDSDKLRPLETVLAIGNPMGFTFSSSQGIVSSVKRNMENKYKYHGVIQTDATINPGNSGGGLYNMDGEVIGVNTIIMTDGGGGGSIGLGFAIPSNVVVDIVDRLITDGEYKRGWIGVGYQVVDKTAADRLPGATEERGVLITSVVPESPAASAGIQSDDIVLGIDGNPVNSEIDIVRGVGSIRPGDSASFTILRDGQTIDIDVEISAKTQTAEDEPEQENDDDDNDSPFTLPPPDEFNDKDDKDNDDDAQDNDDAPDGGDAPDDDAPDNDPDNDDAQPSNARAVLSAPPAHPGGPS